ncbi:hypothetical protein [Streptomyces sp. NPDC021096]|uniref:hypothetical protein n=1 Tax=Streptomyces sp. NPDC021096 TaxID=3154792 RepID=UPI003410C52E
MPLPYRPLLVLRKLRQTAESADDRTRRRVRGLLQTQGRPQQSDPPLGDLGGQVLTGERVQRVGGALSHRTDHARDH